MLEFKESSFGDGWRGGRKISWIKWSQVYQPKAMGRLGVRDVKRVNLSHLAKWRWRLIQGENLLWWWRLEENGVFIVNSMYKKLEEDV